MESLEERVARLEQQVAILQRYLGIDPALPVGDGPFLPLAFYEALRRGKMIHAIKIYREQTGASLREAKDRVEAMARNQQR
ncbi:hypothetical protein [Nonomuraea sp. SYSU D8015]|uniref:hypothetical protein n=1 Tax=Nonomuraea sp. SYSU D8015 TaxID=2593644 RepID=UPI001660C8D3|nr:hypothetical protein [Nonomuraea sp. SYSU D8015]